MVKNAIIFYVLAFCCVLSWPLSNYKESTQLCGRRLIFGARQGRVISGRNVEFGAYPWQVLYIQGNVRCGGSIINSQWVLTAAHCIQKNISIVLYLGFYDSYKLNSPYIKKNVSFISKNPRFDIMNLASGYDIALLKVTEPIVFLPHIQPICLPNPDDDENILGQIGKVAGWGRISWNDSKTSGILREIPAPIIENDICGRMILRGGGNFKFPLNENILCAGFKKGKMNACKGDSGGPLQIQRDDGSWYVAGIVSVTPVQCGESLLPDIYTRVSSFLPWIWKTIENKTEII